METTPVDHISGSIAFADQRVAALRRMTVEQLLDLGKPRVAYVKARLNDDGLVFILYAADGIAILSAGGIEQAADEAAELGLEFIAVD